LTVEGVIWSAYSILGASTEIYLSGFRISEVTPMSLSEPFDL